jgi:hypothetical protein
MEEEAGAVVSVEWSGRVAGDVPAVVTGEGRHPTVANISRVRMIERCCFVCLMNLSSIDDQGERDYSQGYIYFTMYFHSVAVLRYATLLDKLPAGWWVIRQVIKAGDPAYFFSSGRKVRTGRSAGQVTEP